MYRPFYPTSKFNRRVAHAINLKLNGISWKLYYKNCSKNREFFICPAKMLNEYSKPNLYEMDYTLKIKKQYTSSFINKFQKIK